MPYFGAAVPVVEVPEVVEPAVVVPEVVEPGMPGDMAPPAIDPEDIDPVVPVPLIDTLEEPGDVVDVDMVPAPLIEPDALEPLIVPVISIVPVVSPAADVPPRLREPVRDELPRDLPDVVDVDCVPLCIDEPVVPLALAGTPPVLVVLLPVEPPV